MTAATAERAHAARLRLPPYSKKVLALRGEGLAPSTAVLVVDGWAPIDITEYAPWVVVLPDDEPVRNFDFRCLTGLFVLVQASTTRRVAEIAEQVERFWPKVIYGWPEDREQLTYFVREAA
jgi:hypothetical protein